MSVLVLNWVLPHGSRVICATRATQAELPADRKVSTLCGEAVVLPEPDADGNTARRTCARDDRYCDDCVRRFAALSGVHTVHYYLPREGFR